jgi:hypothetical protein
VRDRLAAAGWRVVNVDATINAERPKMAPHIPRMIAAIADDLGIPPERVNVKAKTAEKLGFVGREEGLSAEAVAMIEGAGGIVPHPRPATAQAQNEDFSSFLLLDESRAAEHRIPVSPNNAGGKWQWIPAGERISVAGFSLPGGMLYVGSGLQGANGETEPALIDPALEVAFTAVDVSLRITDYQLGYANISPEARRAYLQWLADGRKAPEASIGCVFLFFYGLERRILLDAHADPAVQAEAPAIKAEIHRLLGIYGGGNSFRRYATHFLNYIDAEHIAAEVSLDAPPIVTGQDREPPLNLKLGLGRLAMDRQPVPANWALAWALADPDIALRTAVTQCEAEFAQLFRQKYTETYGDGFVLCQNETKLKFGYQPASSGFRGESFQRSIGDLPDVSEEEASAQRLKALVDACAEALDPYSRFVGRNPDKAHALEGLLQLPIDLWPAPVKAELEEIRTRVGHGMIIMSLEELSGRFKSAGSLSHDAVLVFARALQDLHFGMEPDVLAGARIPKAEDKIALFAIPPEEGDARISPEYQAAAVTLDLACMTVLANGQASARELLALTRHIDTWSHLGAAHHKRLKARLRLGIDRPATLAELKKTLEPLSIDARRAITRFLARLTQADGVVPPGKVKFLEQTCKTLDIDGKLDYTVLRASEAPPVAAPGPAPQNLQGITLDVARIARIQKETEEAGVFLKNVFDEEYPLGDGEAMPGLPEDEPAQEMAGIPGLDADHSAFVRLLVTRGSWPRNELVDAAMDMGLMPDGALERINEAVLDAFGAPLMEGEDPIEINHEVLEALPV